MRNALTGPETAQTGGPGQCAVCNHKQGRVINEALIAKVPLRLLARTYGMSIAALSRHYKNHISHATHQERKQWMLERLLAKCDELADLELEARRPSDKVL